MKILKGGISMKFNTFIYGFDKFNRCIRYYGFVADRYTIDTIVVTAEQFVEENDEIKQVYVVNGSYEIMRAYKDQKKSNDFTKWIEFKDLVERRGILVK